MCSNNSVINRKASKSMLMPSWFKPSLGTDGFCPIDSGHPQASAVTLGRTSKNQPIAAQPNPTGAVRISAIASRAATGATSNTTPASMSANPRYR